MGSVVHASVAGPLIEATDYQAAHVLTLTAADVGADASGAAAAAQAASQPLDSDLTAIAALSTTSFGRNLLTLANTAALVAAALPAIDATGAATDITTRNVSTSAHGLAPKLPNDATKYLDGSGAYSVPPGSGSTPTLASTLAVGADANNIPITGLFSLTMNPVSGGVLPAVLTEVNTGESVQFLGGHDASGAGGTAFTQGGDATSAGQSGGAGAVVGGAGASGGVGADFVAFGGLDAANGLVQITSNASTGNPNDVLTSDGTFASWQALPASGLTQAQVLARSLGA